jgi:hypothetical protein
MKIVDKTPLVNEKGELGLVERIQGMLKFGFNWPNELAVQRVIVTFFERQLAKGYTLIRNLTLGESGIMIPIILLGPTGIQVIQVTYLKGRYQAKGESWNIESGNDYKPAPINLIQRTSHMARALQKYIERQGVKVPVNIDPVLIAGDPGLHIESERPAIKVMMIDGIKPFVSGLATARPVMSPETAFDLTEHILNPRPPKREPVAPPASEPEPPALWEQQGWGEPQQQEASPTFDASQEAKPFNPADFDFAMTDEAEAMHPVSRETSPAQPLPRSRQKGQRILGMTVPQLAIIAALGLSLICILVLAFAYVMGYIPNIPL